MVNREIQATWYYHNGTKHPHGNLMDPRHSFDPSSQPLLFKIYPDLDPIPLPFEASPSVVPALSAISMEVIPSVGRGVSRNTGYHHLEQHSVLLSWDYQEVELPMGIHAVSCRGLYRCSVPH